MPLLNPYCTVPELIQELKMKPEEVTPGSAIEQELQRAINAGSRWVDNYTSREYFTRDYWDVPLRLNQHSDGIFDDIIFPKLNGMRLRIAALRDITESGTLVADGTDFVLVEGRLQRLGGGNWAVGEWSPALIEIRAAFGYDQFTNILIDRTVTPSMVPRDLPAQIGLVAKLVAAAFSGHNRKEVAGLDGQRQSILSNEIPKTVYQILGRQNPIMI